jgi:hypothetical protein
MSLSESGITVHGDEIFSGLYPAMAGSRRKRRSWLKRLTGQHESKWEMYSGRRSLGDFASLKPRPFNFGLYAGNLVMVSEFPTSFQCGIFFFFFFFVFPLASIRLRRETEKPPTRCVSARDSE